MGPDRRFNLITEKRDELRYFYKTIKIHFIVEVLVDKFLQSSHFTFAVI